MRERSALVAVIVVLAAAGLEIRAPVLAATPDSAWDRALLARGVSPGTIPDPFAITVDMQRAARNVAGELPARERLLRLQQFLFDGIAFDYEAGETVSAAVAFEQGRGNCVAFTSMFIAMARSLGIPAQPALIYSSGRDELEGDLVISTNHIVALYRDGPRLLVYDFSVLRSGTPLSVQPVDDLWMGAIYLSNRGVIALRAGDLEGAEDRFEAALRLAPGYSALWSNLGVVRRRMGNLDGALDAYLLALQLEHSNASARRNLGALLEHRSSSGDRGAGPRDAVDDAMTDGDAALQAGEARRASRFYRRAHRRAPRDPAPLVAMARSNLLAGKTTAAIRWLEQALAASPGFEPARRLRASILRVRSTGPAAVPIPVPPEWRVAVGSPLRD